MKGVMFGALLAVAAPSVVAAQDAPAAAAIDPARQAAADRAVAALVPNGVYTRMMRDQFPAMMDAMTAQMMGMGPEDFGQPADGKTMAETMHETDPAYEERMKITTRVMSQEMGTVMGKMEPRVRAGLGRAFARKFTVQQLGDMNAFFATPSGKAFADEYLALFADPEMMTEMTAMAPEMMKAMPDMMKKVEAATAHLPPVKKPAEDAAE
jgi:hypothetical protein